MPGSGYRTMRRLRIAALVEGTTLVALTGIAVPLKHLADVPVAVSVLGPLHGMAFITYLWLVAATVSDGGWSRREVCVTVASSLVPFGAFLVARLLERKAAALAARRGAWPGVSGVMDWLWVKAVHIAAAVTWLSGLLAATLFVNALCRPGGRLCARELRAVAFIRRWDRGFTTPAMLLVWALGLVLAVQLQWSGSAWLWAKVGIVGFVSMLHGLCVGSLKRLERVGHAETPAPLRLAPVLIVSSVLLIAVLAVVKPL